MLPSFELIELPLFDIRAEVDGPGPRSGLVPFRQIWVEGPWLALGRLTCEHEKESLGEDLVAFFLVILIFAINISHKGNYNELQFYSVLTRCLEMHVLYCQMCDLMPSNRTFASPQAIVCV